MKDYYEVYTNEHFTYTIEWYNFEGKHVVHVCEEFPVIAKNEVKWVHNNWCEEFKTYEAANAFFARLTETRILRKMEFEEEATE